jgi:uncharacterized protein YraI
VAAALILLLRRNPAHCVWNHDAGRPFLGQGLEALSLKGFPMPGKNSLWTVGAVLAGLMLPSQAMAQYDAHTAVDLNLRVGPGTEYGIIDVIPAGYPVVVLGCLDAYQWCDVEWDGLRGWVFARYLVQPGTTVYLPQYAPRIGVPIVTFSFGTYHDRYYRDRPWYRERYGSWRGRDWRDRDRDRDRDRVEEREERQEAERPRRQRDADRPQQPELVRPRLQEREARPQQQQEREARPQQEGERTQQQGDRPRQGKRVQRQGSGAPPEELLKERGQ